MESDLFANQECSRVTYVLIYYDFLFQLDLSMCLLNSAAILLKNLTFKKRFRTISNRFVPWDGIHDGFPIQISSRNLLRNLSSSKYWTLLIGFYRELFFHFSLHLGFWSVQFQDIVPNVLVHISFSKPRSHSKFFFPY